MFKLHIQIAKNKDSKNTRITVTLTDITKKNTTTYFSCMTFNFINSIYTDPCININISINMFAFPACQAFI